MIIRQALILLFLGFTCLLQAQEKNAPNKNSLRLKAGDQLEMSIFGHDDMTRILTITNDGEAFLELAGPLKIEGMTLREANEAVTKAYKPDYYKNPKVTLKLLEAAADKISVMGAVVVQQDIVVKDRGNPIDLLQAIAKAGGPSQTADLTKITLTRRDGTSKQFDYNQLQKNRAKKVLLTDGDRVDIAFNQNANKVVTIIGEVLKPGDFPFPLNGNITVKTLIGQAGGFNQRATTRGIKITRGGRDYGLSNGMRTRLSPGDVVTIPVNPNVGKFVTMAGHITTPGKLAMPLNGRLTVSDAVANAGGKAKLGDLRRITVTRGRKNIPINLQKVREGKANDMLLQNGDTVTVKERKF